MCLRYLFYYYYNDLYFHLENGSSNLKVGSINKCFVQKYSTNPVVEDSSVNYEFQTETAELLNIVAKSLYSENEVKL